MSKLFRKYLSNIPGKHNVKIIYKTAILVTAHLLRKALMAKYKTYIMGNDIVRMYVCMYVCMCVGFRTFLHCQTHRLHCFLSSHLLSFRFLSFMAFLIPSIQFYFGLPRALFCFGIHFNAILGNLPSYQLTWYRHVQRMATLNMAVPCNLFLFWEITLHVS